MEIRRVTSVDDALVDAFARLVPQLSKSPPPTRDDLAAIARDAALLVAVDAGAIVGALTLTVYRIPTGRQARIDDVVGFAHAEFADANGGDTVAFDLHP
jgi:hypothetical protein